MRISHMRISYTHTFASIHVPTVAGLSIRRALLPYRHSPKSYWAHRVLDRVGVHVNHYAPYT
jgi:hypothetical protein